jgi:hypothetical protein
MRHSRTPDVCYKSSIGVSVFKRIDANHLRIPAQRILKSAKVLFSVDQFLSTGKRRLLGGNIQVIVSLIYIMPVLT